jgi:hypothetical protein
MKKTLLTGVLLAVAGALSVWIGTLLNLGLRSAIYGAALGAVLGLVRNGSVVGRLVGFLLGVAIAWIGYAVRAAALPDIVSGQIVAVVIVVGLVTLVAVLSAGRVPMWTGLLGAAALIGAYEELYAAAPYNFLSESVVAVSALLVPVGFGFLVGVLSDSLFGDDDDPPQGGGRSGAPSASSEGLAIMNQGGAA